MWSPLPNSSGVRSSGNDKNAAAAATPAELDPWATEARMVAQLAAVAAAQVQSGPMTPGPHAAIRPHASCSINACVGKSNVWLDQTCV